MRRISHAAAAFGVCALPVLWACASKPDKNSETVVVGPNLAQFKGPASPAEGEAGVSTYLERRCGTLDCHGAAGRALRIYGARGLRLDQDGGRPDQGATTDLEVIENYRSAVGLEPELTQAVLDVGGEDADRLLLVKKPRSAIDGAGESHKGGQLTTVDGDGDKCLTSWLSGKTDFRACGRAAFALRP